MCWFFLLIRCGFERHSTAIAPGAFPHYVNNHQCRSVATFTSAAFFILVMITLLIYTLRCNNSLSKISTSVLKFRPELLSLPFHLDGIVREEKWYKPKTPHNKSPSHKYNSTWTAGILKKRTLGLSETSWASHPKIQIHISRDPKSSEKSLWRLTFRIRTVRFFNPFVTKSKRPLINGTTLVSIARQNPRFIWTSLHDTHRWWHSRKENIRG